MVLVETRDDDEASPTRVIIVVIASELARPPPRADDAEAAASKRRALAVTAQKAVEAEMKASAGPLKAIPADSPYKPWALDAKNQRWRLQAMHPVYKRRPP